MLDKFLTRTQTGERSVNAPFAYLYGCNVRNHTVTLFENGFVRSWSRLLIIIVGVPAINKRTNQLVLGSVTKVWKPCTSYIHDPRT